MNRQNNAVDHSSAWFAAGHPDQQIQVRPHVANQPSLKLRRWVRNVFVLPEEEGGS